MSGFSAIDLAQLPSPDIIENLSFEAILQSMLSDLIQRDPSFNAYMESDPVYKILEVAAYREVLLRARINDAAKGVMLAYAVNADLDNLAGFFGVTRQVIDEGDPDAIPPIEPKYESDDRLRKRVQLSMEGHSTAGPIGSYVYHALAASPQVKDVDVSSPHPGEVLVTVLSSENQGVPDQALIDQVFNQLNEDSVRPLTDHVTVEACQIVSYEVQAKLYLYDGPDANVVEAKSIEAISQYVKDHHLLGNDITLSGIYAALHQPGVERVELIKPTSNITLSQHEAGWCERITVD
jgi:phage-related baseplate assembly protein